MKKVDLNPFLKKASFLVLLFASLLAFKASAHNVTLYTRACNNNTQYVITPTVTNVSNNTNYSWQYKNSGGTWVCFTNGNNTINGIVYSVTGAFSNQTTNPGPITITNPNINLQGLVVRIIMCDGAGTTPCTTTGPTYNSDNNSVNTTINLSGTPCGAPGSIGDRVWQDSNGNGIQDASETGGINNVTVTLLNSVGTVIATTITNASGIYIFNNLPAGNYTVQFPTTLTDLKLSTSKVGSNNNVDSDPSTTTGKTATITITNGLAVTTVDAGYTPTNIQLGDRIFYDTNNNGINDGENGIAGVTVNLYADANNDNTADGAAIATLVSDATGHYNFTGLTPGNYIVGAILPAGYTPSAVNGGDPDNNIDLDNNGINITGNEVRGLAITLVAGTEFDGTNSNTNNNITYDIGMLPNCNCSAANSNAIVNGSFETNTNGWTASGATFTSSNLASACGTNSGVLAINNGSNSAKVYQDVNIASGASIILRAFMGTTTAGLNCSPKLSVIFYGVNNNQLGVQYDVPVTRDASVNNGQLEQYSIIATSPAGTVRVRIQATVSCDGLAMDAVCLNVSGGTVLPVTLTEFNAVRNNCTANISWKTATETNVDKFEVEVSANGTAAYAKANTVTSLGNSTEAKSYQFSYPMQTGVVYYFRLKTIDKDGNFSYSDVRKVSCSDKINVTLSPNPVIGQFKLSGLKAGKNVITVYSSLGQRVASTTITQTQGMVDVSNLPSGVYHVRITDEAGISSVIQMMKN